MTRYLLGVLLSCSAAGSWLAAEREAIGAGPELPDGVAASSRSVGNIGNNGFGSSARYGDYRIGPEDVLNISVWNNSAISRTVPVRPDGKISLPLVNDVHAAGLTPNQLRTVLMKKLAEFIPSPEVSVIIEEVHSFKVSVIGEVKKTGRHELKGGATVLDVLAMGEGFGDFASRGRIVVLRAEGKTMRQIPFNYNKVVSSDGVLENFLLQPGDIIVVP